MNEPSGTIERLASRLEELERRVEALEHPLAAPWPRPSRKTDESPSPASTEATGGVKSAGVFAVLGKAMLGIAGAYLLRAFEESASAPRLLVACGGIFYAFLWLVGAARAGARWRVASTAYACTSVLILAPMLWELTLRFKLLPVGLVAGVLCAYAVAAFWLSRKHDLMAVLRICSIGAAGLLLALDFASHLALPFVAALIALAALGEFAPGRDRLLAVRVCVALAADVAIWSFIYIYFNPYSARGDYPELNSAALLAPGIAVFLVFAAGVGLQTFVGGARISVFETLQLTIAFLLFAVSFADFGPASGTTILGILCLILSAASYAAVIAVFARQSDSRNSVVFAAWAAGLLVCGCLLCLSSGWAAGCLGAAAVASTFAGGQKKWPAFDFYGAIFLFVAAAESGLPRFLFSALVGTPSGAPALVAVSVALCSVLCYAIAMPRADEGWKWVALHLAVAALALGAVAALVTQALVAFVALGLMPGTHHVALIRTLTLCGAALALVFGGAHWRRGELTKLGYAVLVLVAIKLVAEDLRHGHLAYIAASLCVFAITLIAAPRMARVRLKA